MCIYIYIYIKGVLGFTVSRRGVLGFTVSRRLTQTYTMKSEKCGACSFKALGPKSLPAVSIAVPALGSPVDNACL